MSNQLNDLIRDVLTQWTGLLPRLVYVTDAGQHETDYYNDELNLMPNPHRPDGYLFWERVVDYYHACEYIGKLANALFGQSSEGHSWAVKMRRWLKHKRGGINRVLHSAAAIRHQYGLVGLADEYDPAYEYLRSRIQFMDYVEYRKYHLPIGSGVTEAACKTVFTQRLKQSGMSWGIKGGQVVTDLRVIHLSGIWEATRDAYHPSYYQTWELKLLSQPNRPKKPHKRWYWGDCTRLKGNGIIWLQENAEAAMLVLRAAALTDRWDESLNHVRKTMAKSRRLDWDWAAPDMPTELQEEPPPKPPRTPRPRTRQALEKTGVTAVAW